MNNLEITTEEYKELIAIKARYELLREYAARSIGYIDDTFKLLLGLKDVTMRTNKEA